MQIIYLSVNLGAQIRNGAYRRFGNNQWRIQDFPLGGANLRQVHFSVKTHAKMKELDPVGGRSPAPPGSANGNVEIPASKRTQRSFTVYYQVNY